MNPVPPPPITLPFPREELDGATVAFIEHRNSQMVREIGRLVATGDRITIETLSVADDPYRRIARSFILTQAQAETLRRLPAPSEIAWECGSVLSGSEFRNADDGNAG